MPCNMERETSLARKSAVLGPVIEVVEQFQSGDKEAALRTMQEFLGGTEVVLLKLDTNDGEKD